MVFAPFYVAPRVIVHVELDSQSQVDSRLILLGAKKNPEKNILGLNISPRTIF
jgi:hypothetical protein